MDGPVRPPAVKLIMDESNWTGEVSRIIELICFRLQITIVVAPHPPLQDMIIKRRSSVGGRSKGLPKRLLRFMEAKLVI